VRKNILQYESAKPPQRGLLFESVCIAFVTVPAHGLFSFYVLGFLEVHFGSSTRAWTCLAWLPACIPRNLNSNVALFVLVLLGSLSAGTITASTAVRCLHKIDHPLGLHYWRLWLTLCAWLLWFPVPHALALVY